MVPDPSVSKANVSVHSPVMAAEILEQLALSPGMTVVDGTLGGGGHARLLAEAVGPTGVVIGIDRDPAVIARARREFSGTQVRCLHGSYADLPQLIQSAPDLAGVTIQALVLDLGLSSDQLADPERGFSFQSPGPLDMRFDVEEGESAAELLARMDERKLADLIFKYGEERYSRRIARQIVSIRKTQPIKTAAQLADIVRRSVPRRGHQRLDPATRTFQALRIAVNGELEELERALRMIPERLATGGRIAILSFHSLEDRIVKSAFRDDPRFAMIARKPWRPSEAEISRNPRARSAKLRVAAVNLATTDEHRKR